MRVAVLRALPGLGDFLCAVPALRALAPHDVTLIGLAASRRLAGRFGAYVDDFAEFPGWPGIPETAVDARRTETFLAAAKLTAYDLALQLHGSGRVSAGFVERLGAARTGGFVPAGAPLPGDGWLEWDEDEPEVRRPLRLLEHLGLPTAGEHLEFPVSEDDEREAAALGLPRPYACLHAGSSLPDRRWPAERFAAVADAVSGGGLTPPLTVTSSGQGLIPPLTVTSSGQGLTPSLTVTTSWGGLTPVLTGTLAEAPAVEAVASAMRAPYVSLVGRTSVGALACVLRDAAVVITNDTGTSHLAAAVRAPSVVVHTVTDPARWAPLDRTLHRPLRGDVSVEAVLAAVEDVASAPCGWSRGTSTR